MTPGKLKDLDLKHVARQPGGSEWRRFESDFTDERGNRFGVGSVVHATATMGAGNTVDPFGVIGPGVELGDRNTILSFSVVGAPSQARVSPGDPRLTVGSGCVFHPHATISVGALPGGTVLGDDVIVMAGAHVGHDCVISDRAAIGNYAQLGGHVLMDTDAPVSAHACVVQRMILGAGSYVLPRIVCRSDVWPFETRGEPPARRFNSIGLRRRGDTAADTAQIKLAWFDPAIAVDGLVADDDIDRAFKLMREARARRPSLSTTGAGAATSKERC